MKHIRNACKGRKGERGNILFLILIAVALFAALSYAVTQSSRSGSGNASSETNLVDSATITQYPASVRTSIIKMMVEDSVNVADMEFNTPSDFSHGGVIDDTSLTNASVKQAVFYPAGTTTGTGGGGATYENVGGNLMDNGSEGTWHFNESFNIPGVGSSANDLIAFVSGIKKSVCSKIDEQLGIGSTIPTVAAAVNVAVDQLSDGTSQTNPAIVPSVPVTPADIIDTGNALHGQGFGCFENGTGSGTYVYYHVLVDQ